MILNEEDIKYFNRRILGEKNVRPNCNYSFSGKTLIEAQDKIDELKLDNDVLTVGNARLRALLEFHGDNKNHHHELYNAITARAEKAEAEVEELKEVISEAMRRLKPNKEKESAE